MRIIGLTGGIATGKSTVARMFEKLGAKIIDADEIAREIVRPGEKTFYDIVHTFGNDILSEDGTLDRKKLGEIIFSDLKAREKLNAITHPNIGEAIAKKISEYAEDEDSIVIIDAALLLENPSNESIRPIIVVSTDRETQISRLVNRDGCAKSLATKMVSSQRPVAEKVKLADFVIDNSGTIEQTLEQVKGVWAKIK